MIVVNRGDLESGDLDLVGEREVLQPNTKLGTNVIHVLNYLKELVVVVRHLASFIEKDLYLVILEKPTHFNFDRLHCFRLRDKPSDRRLRAPRMNVIIGNPANVENEVVYLPGYCPINAFGFSVTHAIVV